MADDDELKKRLHAKVRLVTNPDPPVRRESAIDGVFNSEHPGQQDLLVFITDATIARLAQSPKDIYLSSKLAEDVLKRPLAIWRGLRRKNASKCLCYVGQPKYKFRPDGQTEQALPNEMFLVFIYWEEDVERYYVERWHWVPCGWSANAVENECSKRFEVKLWPA